MVFGLVRSIKTVDKIEFKGIDIMDIIKYYGSDETKTEFINHDSEPLMAVIAHDRSHAVVSLLDEGL